MPRFSIKNLLVATALIAVGCGMMWTAIHLPKVYFPGDVARNMTEKVILWFGGGALIGAGIGTPLGNWYIGGIVVLMLQASTLVLVPLF